MTPDTSWFREARYGMFIHFGLYSVLGRHEWAMCHERIPVDEYRRLTAGFSPDADCTTQWANLAAQSGMRYVCLTARHHDGFSLFPTATDDYHSGSLLGRDLVGEYVEACRAAGLRVGIYYSVLDWSDPRCVAGPKGDRAGWDAFIGDCRTELLELMTGYGPVDYLFYDGCPPVNTWDPAEVNAQIRRRQPGILISSRCGLPEDVDSAEQHTIADPGKLWESCMTANGSWGYNAGDPDWKTARQVVQTLAICAHNGGNLLFNMGPDGHGRIPPEGQRLLGEVGRWLERNGEAIYGTDPHPFDYQDQRLTTSRGNTAYFALFHYHGPATTLISIANEVQGVRVLGTGQEVAFRQEGPRLFLEGLPVASPDPIMTVLAVELDGPPRALPHPLLDRSKYEV
ncbi:alpha-L-fucosidase [bacterium]|nr:alpha-L-fucosidase [bacterium]